MRNVGMGDSLPIDRLAQPMEIDSAKEVKTEAASAEPLEGTVAEEAAPPSEAEAAGRRLEQRLDDSAGRASLEMQAEPGEAQSPEAQRAGYDAWIHQQASEFESWTKPMARHLEPGRRHIVDREAFTRPKEEPQQRIHDTEPIKQGAPSEQDPSHWVPVSNRPAEAAASNPGLEKAHAAQARGVSPENQARIEAAEARASMARANEPQGTLVEDKKAIFEKKAAALEASLAEKRANEGYGTPVAEPGVDSKGNIGE